MIRINLLGVQREQPRQALVFGHVQRIATACALILTIAAAGIGWWYWTLQQQSAQVDADIASAQQEAARLRTVLNDVKQFEAQRAQLQQRVQLIQQLRGGQSVPVQLLDQVSRSLPDMLWLNEMNENSTSVTLSGMSTTLIAVSDFVANLGNSSLLKKPIEIVNTEVQTGQAGAGAPAAELIKFTVKAQLAGAVPAKAAPAQPR
jgi:type IV pilus assembly protein PilN